jgi:hypothetical protein
MSDVAASDGTVLTVAAARAHLKVGAAMEQAIADVIPAAEGRIESFLGRELVGLTGWERAELVPAIVVHCVKLALSDFWINREAPELTDDQLRPIIGRFMVVSVG